MVAEGTAALSSPFGYLLGTFWDPLGRSWAPLGHQNGPPNRLREPSWTALLLFPPYFSALGSPREPLGASWEPLRSLLEASPASLGPSWLLKTTQNLSKDLQKWSKNH